VYKGNLKESAIPEHQDAVFIQKLVNVLLPLPAVQKYILHFNSTNYQIKIGIIL
jgi:hypothetical protein